MIRPSFNPDDLNSFRAISNLSFLSKIIDRVVMNQFIHHADQNKNWLPPDSQLTDDLIPPSQQCWSYTTTSCMLLMKVTSLH